MKRTELNFKADHFAGWSIVLCFYLRNGYERVTWSHFNISSIGPNIKFFLDSANSSWAFGLFDLILYVLSTIFQLYRDGSSWVEPVLS